MAIKAFDFVVLGAGAAGCAAARGLARRYPEATVALVEQGGEVMRDAPWCVRVPLLQRYVASSRRTRHCLRAYCSEKEAALGGRDHTYLRGCGLGGSTLCNSMRYLRGSRGDYLSWGQSAWEFEQVLPAYMSLERNSREASAVHGEDGPLPVTDGHASNVQSQLNILWYEACEAAGVPQSPELNGGDVDGFASLQSLIERGSRVDVFRALLANDAHLTPNLTVFTGTRVQRLQFDERRRAVAAEVAPVGAGSPLLADRLLRGGQFIVCLGAIESPALLLRSGVGEQGAVAMVAGVGKNLIEATTVDMTCRIRNAANLHTKSFSFTNFGFMRRQWQEYQEERTGVFASLSEAVAFVRSTGLQTAPDLSLILSAFPILTGRRYTFFDGYTVSVTHHQPTSRGEVALADDGTTRVRGNLLSTREDVQAMDEGVQWASLLCGPQSPLKSVYHSANDGSHTAPFNGLAPVVQQPAAGIQTQLQMAAFLAEFTRGSGDLFGTCAMGSVVDDHLLVQGLGNVRVADSSVVPRPMTGTSSVVGAMIGTRLASLV